MQVLARRWGVAQGIGNSRCPVPLHWDSCFTYQHRSAWKPAWVSAWRHELPGIPHVLCCPTFIAWSYANPCFMRTHRSSYGRTFMSCISVLLHTGTHASLCQHVRCRCQQGRVGSKGHGGILRHWEHVAQ